MGDFSVIATRAYHRAMAAMRTLPILVTATLAAALMACGGLLDIEDRGEVSDASADTSTGMPNVSTGSSTDSPSIVSDAFSQVSNETGTDSTRESGTDSIAGDDSGDSSRDAGGGMSDGDATGASSGIAPLNWCSMMLVDFGFPANAGDSASNVALQIVVDPSNPSSFIPALNADCRFGGLTGVLDGSAIDFDAWLNQMGALTQWMIGCSPFDAGTPTLRDLLPVSQAAETLTQADVNDLATTFVTAITSEVTFQDVVDFSGGQPLTTAQIQQLQDTVNAIAAATPNVTSSTTSYTYDACGD